MLSAITSRFTKERMTWMVILAILFFSGLFAGIYFPRKNKCFQKECPKQVCPDPSVMCSMLSPQTCITPYQTNAVLWGNVLSTFANESNLAIRYRINFGEDEREINSVDYVSVPGSESVLFDVEKTKNAYILESKYVLVQVTVEDTRVVETKLYPMPWFFGKNKTTLFSAE